VPYLRQFLGFIGIHDVEVVVAEGLAISEQSREQGLGGARRAIETLVATMPACGASASTGGGPVGAFAV
jgi:hypothetical protein